MQALLSAVSLATDRQGSKRVSIDDLADAAVSSFYSSLFEANKRRPASKTGHTSHAAPGGHDKASCVWGAYLAPAAAERPGMPCRRVVLVCIGRR